ncbi:farnesyl pyrophosphate synthase [Galendromus occidentalis]|uniref:Farnesyl pyrophosphate synthase n=1 Tax=Galendromus occidentalis TaxID=34638 RepID=A0AAJ6QMS7_9ACAR|nr:farnesyl pyrophosphate synthase [Galendromus occidentalis]
MLIAIRRLSSSLSSLTHLSRRARPRRNIGSLSAVKPRNLGERQASVGSLVGVAAAVNPSRNSRRCFSAIQITEIGSRYAKKTSSLPLVLRHLKHSQIGFICSNHSTMEPIVAEYFADVERLNILEVTSGAHPIVDAAFEKLLDTISSAHDGRLKEFSEWIRKVIDYNVPQGKRNRLVAVMLAYQSLEKGEITAEKLEKAAVLGWCVELLQAFFLICDDIMDNSVTRRGRKCWYLVDGVNMMAINDAILCESAIYHLLKSYFRSHPNYIDMMELFHEVSLQTASGQCLDMLSERKGGSFSEETYDSIVVYKTAYYSFSLPIRLGMYLAGISDEKSHLKTESLALRIGHIFQVQDDYLDCFGDPEVIGKVGTDITDAKCSWLVVKALQVATPPEKSRLLSFYGKGSPGGPEEVEVKKIYDHLSMEKIFREFEEQAFQQIRDEIEKLDHADTPLRSDIFKLLVNKIYRRNK